MFVSHAVGVCGSEQALFALLKGLDRARYDPIVAVPSEGLLKERLSEIGVRTIICPAMIWMPLKQMPFFLFILKYYILLPLRILKFVHLMQREDVDLVFSNELLLLEGGIAARLLRRPHIYHIHNALLSTYFRIYLPLDFILWFTLKLADKMVFVSKKQIQEIFGESPKEEKLRVITQGFDTQYFSREGRSGNEWRIKEQISNDSSLVVLIALLTRHKGQEDFIRASHIVSRSLPDTTFVMIGKKSDEEYIKDLSDLVFELKIQDKIIFIDYVEDLASVYHSLDLLVCASWNETFGRTIVEAMLAGKPVVSTRCGGPEDIVIDGVTGLLVPVKSPQDLAEAMIKLLRDRELAERMGGEGKKRAEGCYSMQLYARSMQEVIEECI